MFGPLAWCDTIPARFFRRLLGAVRFPAMVDARSTRSNMISTRFQYDVCGAILRAMHYNTVFLGARMFQGLQGI